MRLSDPERLAHAHAQFLAADARVHALRRQFASHAMPTATAYVMFEHPVSETICTQALVHSSLTSLRVSRAPPPADIEFAHMSVPPVVSFIRAVLVGVGIFFLIFFWCGSSPTPIWLHDN